MATVIGCGFEVGDNTNVSPKSIIISSPTWKIFTGKQYRSDDEKSLLISQLFVYLERINTLLISRDEINACKMFHF